MDTPDCTLVDREDRMVSYLAGTLSADEAEAFEAHYFACAQCWRELQQGLEIRAALAPQLDKPAVVVPFAAAAAPATRRLPWRLLAAAATIVLVASVWRVTGNRTVPGNAATALSPPVPSSSASSVPSAVAVPTHGAPTLPMPNLAVTPDELAHVDPPPYAPVVLRGPRNEAVVQFDTAMGFYVKKDYARAIPDLRATIGLDSKMPSATYFLAICQLLTDQIDPAVEGLHQTIALGESPYLQEAHFYLAKALLRQGRLADARDELAHAIEHGGLLQRDAQKLKTQVEALMHARGK